MRLKNKISAKTFADKSLSNVFEYRDGGYYKYTTSNGYSTEEQAQVQKGVQLSSLSCWWSWFCVSSVLAFFVLHLLCISLQGTALSTNM